MSRCRLLHDPQAIDIEDANHSAIGFEEPFVLQIMKHHVDRFSRQSDEIGESALTELERDHCTTAVLDPGFGKVDDRARLLERL